MERKALPPKTKTIFYKTLATHLKVSEPTLRKRAAREKVNGIEYPREAKYSTYIF